MQIDITNTLQLQSPYLYCQASGSEGADGSKPGIHLRWDLMKHLGENHIPKGNLGHAGVFFDKNEDYVRIYRSPVMQENFGYIDFDNLDINQLAFLPNDEGIVYTGYNASNSNSPKVIVRFKDKAQFSQIMTMGLDPNDPIQDFLSKYTGVMEIEVEGKTMFWYEAEFIFGNGGGDCFIETVSRPDKLDPQSKRVIKRSYADQSKLVNDGVSTTGENMSMIRVQSNNMQKPSVFRFMTYEDMFVMLQEQGTWEEVGNGFALTTDATTAYTRFQGEPYISGNLVLDWPKYNDGVMLVPENYMDRWSNSDDGLEKMVQQFLSIAPGDPRANINLPDDSGTENGITVSLLDMLKLVAMDYHGARMLGLGHLAEGSEASYIYAAVYTTLASLPGMDYPVDHVYMTLPTRITDIRSPLAPQLEDVSYGLYVSTDDNNPPELISDPNGYSYNEPARYVILNKKNTAEPQVVASFIPDNDSFDGTQITQPAGFGIEYGSSPGAWQDPELLHDDQYYTASGQPETSITPEKTGFPFYTHRETNPGVHSYAMYTVDWFSRPSGLSNAVSTDYTNFPKRNYLLPPFNLAVQYIQEEDPLIFTTQQEQTDLAAANVSNPTGDNYKTRIIFDWDNIHHNAYQAANKVEFFFRETPIRKVEGKIRKVTSLNTTDTRIETNSFAMTSVSPAVTITPVIIPADIPKFIGSLLNTPDGQFQVLSISDPVEPGDGPVFVVKKLVTRDAYQAAPDDPMVIVPVYTEPKENDIFFVLERADDPAQWTKLNRTVDLVNFSSTTELIYEDDDSTHNEVVNGINGNATITDINGSNGGYTVQFNSGVNLTPHPDPTVKWVKGSARFVRNDNNNKKKRLAVVAIQQTNPISLVVYDADYLINVNERIKTGSNIPVNFHPSYKLYLNPEAGIFDKNKTMPAANVNHKKTYIAARSTDTTMNYKSPLTSPSILVARNVQKAITPVAILSPTHATRPDFYGKATYTLDIELNVTNRIPYGVVVYRCTEMAVLQTLYSPATVTQVLTDLAAISDNDPLRFNRWKSLVEVETDPGNNNQFKLFGSYRFPVPDNSVTKVYTSAVISVNPFPINSPDTIFSKKALIKKVIEDVFTPLTETPVVFAYLKTGYQTSGDKPQTRDIVGRLLNPQDPLFNPHPMAVKYPAVNPNKVRFTDYSLDGNARNIYFYFAREVSMDMKYSERTPMTGPVVLVDAAPAEKPVVRTIITREADPELSQPPAVLFELAQYISSENIQQFQVFRTTDFSKASSVRTMELAATVDADDPVKDEFSDLIVPPFGEPLYYRIVALRQIVNEKQQPEMIPSQPSEVVLTNIIDVLNPIPPVITPVISTTQTNGSGQVTALLNVTLQWPKSAHNGTYYLYKMSEKGNWEKLWQIDSNANQLSFPPTGDFVTYPQTANLVKMDADGNVIYHRFKVMVENANGLLNTTEQVLTL